MRQKRKWTWLPKVFILAIVLAVFMPTPRYISTMGPEEYNIWLVRVAWVLLLTIGCSLAAFIAGRLFGKDKADSVKEHLEE